METTFVGGTEKVSLTEELLELICMVQRYKAYLISKNMFDKSEGKTDWYRETEILFNSLNNETLAKYKLSKNKISFEKVLHFEITEEIESTLFEELPSRFSF